jgi:hypothetical protein
MKLNGKSENNSSLSTQGRIIRRCLGMLGTVLLVILLNGCASIATSKDPDPYKYNPATGYPVVGGPSFGDF